MAGQTDDLIDRLIQSQLASALWAYQGNLNWAIHVVSNGWLPSPDAPGVQQHVEALRRHMAQIGKAEDDDFLLRLGLTAPGTQRGIVPPLMVLDEDRGGFPPRRQVEAEGQILRLREALAIGRRLLPRLSQDTQQAVAELANLSQTRSTPSDADWLRWFQELSADEADQLARCAIEFLDGDVQSVSDVGTEILRHLACFRPPPLSETRCLALIERGAFWPSCVYRDAGDAVAAELIARIDEAAETPSLNQLLLALAWTRCRRAHEAFRQWDTEPPGWASQLYVPPSDYLQHAGWCLDEAGERRDLISPTCFRLLPVASASARSVRCLTTGDERCPSCGGPLGWLFDLSAIDAEYFPGELAEAPRKILCCFHCACYEPVFVSYGDSGPTWLAPMDPCEFEYDGDGDREACVREIDDAPCPPFACAEPFTLDDASTLGGIPMWLQDAAFPRCLECSRVMTFLAQHDNGGIGEEGIYYAFFCALCHVAAVTYQQT